MVPPVAVAQINLKIKNNQNHGENAAATPLIVWTITAITNGSRLPNLKIKYNKNYD